MYPVDAERGGKLVTRISELLTVKTPPDDETVANADVLLYVAIE